MKKKMMKACCEIFILVLFVFIMYKYVQYYVLLKMNKSMNDFFDESNRYYQSDCINGYEIISNKIFWLNNKRKTILEFNNKIIYNEFVDFEVNIKYYVRNNKIFSYKLEENEKNINNDFLNLQNFPMVISQIYLNDKLNFDELFSIHYIIPIKYNNQSCYKIASKNEIVIVDKETYLPMYYFLKVYNSNGVEETVEYTYEFDVGSVTEEQVLMPDLNEYQIIEY